MFVAFHTVPYYKIHVLVYDKQMPLYEKMSGHTCDLPLNPQIRSYLHSHVLGIQRLTTNYVLATQFTYIMWTNGEQASNDGITNHIDTCHTTVEFSSLENF